MIRDLYWVVPIMVAILDILFLTPNNTSCLFIEMDVHSPAEIATMILLVALTLVPPVLTIILSSLTNKLIGQSIMESGRHETRANIVISVRFVFLNAINAIQMFSLGTLIIIQFLQQKPPDALTFCLMFLGAHVPSTIHPLLFFQHGK